MNTPIPPTIGKITSKSKTIIQKFLKSINESGEIDKLLNQIHSLQEIPTWTNSQHNVLEDIDRKYTKGRE
jgi:hypothetical protein